MPGLIDSHCHLTSRELWPHVEAVLARAYAAGVSRFITIATDLDDAANALVLSQRDPRVFVACGIHPHEAGKVAPDWQKNLRRLVQRNDVCAVGETGLDYHYDFADRAAQHEVFRRHISLAREVDKPLIIHCREAHRDALDLLADGPVPPAVVFHCFTGTPDEADEILRRGYWLSFTGVLTFKRSDALRAVAARLPAAQLMIETDSPYLSPEPLRNVRPNEPAHLVHTAACLADVRGMAPAELTDLTAANTRRFFSLPE